MAKIIRPVTLDGTAEISEDGAMTLRVVGVLASQGPPGIPQGLEVLEFSEDFVELTWVQGGDATSWIVMRSEDGGALEDLATVTSVGYLDDTVLNDTDYEYRLRATSPYGESDPCSPVFVTTTIQTAASVPTGLNVVAAGASSVAIAWNTQDDAFEWDVYRGGGFVATVDVPQYLDTNVTLSQSYSYQVLARNSTGDSALCTAVVANTPANQLPVWTLGNQSATAGTSFSIDLRNFCTDADGHTLTFSVFSGGVTGLAVNGFNYGGTISAAAGTYPVVLRASDGFGSTDVTISFVVVSAADLTPPSAPVISLAINGSTATITVTTPSTDASGIGKYNLQRSSDNVTYVFQETILVPDLDFVQSGLAPQLYYWRVRSQDASPNENYSAFSNVVSGTVVAPPATPDAPIQFVANRISNSRIDLSWAPGPSGATPTSYELQFSLNQSSWTTLTLAGPLSLTYSHTGLAANTIYYYRVRAVAGTTPSGYTLTNQTTQAPASFPLYGLGTDRTSYATWRNTNDVIKGRDYSKPPDETYAFFSGTFLFGNAGYPPNFPGKKLKKLDIDWKDMEPTRAVNPGVPASYNFSMFNQLATQQYITEGYHGFQIDIRGTVWSKSANNSANITAPAWMVAGLAPASHHSGNGGGTGFEYFDCGDPKWSGPFRQLITALCAYIIPNSGGKKYFEMPSLITEIIHGQSTSLGEEQGLGLNPTGPDGHVETIRRWCVAAGAGTANDYSYKFGWCGEGDPDDLLVMNAGAGGRGGIIERWLSRYMPGGGNQDFGVTLIPYLNSAGQTQTNQHYLGIDETYPIIAENRHWADQNEEYRASAFGSTPVKQWENAPTRWHIMFRNAVFHMLQMRRMCNAIETKGDFKTGNNHSGGGNLASPLGSGPDSLAINGYLGYVNPAMLNWCSLEHGKRWDGVGGNTAIAREVWCVPCKFYSYQSGALRTYHNWERGVTQREAWGATASALNEPYGWNPGNDNLTSGFWNMDVARKATTATGMGFKIVSGFMPAANSPVVIKVQYWDNNTDNWTLNYRNQSGVNVAVQPAELNDNSADVQTATFFLDDFRQVPGQTTDFEIKGSTNTPILMVRVLLRDDPT